MGNKFEIESPVLTEACEGFNPLKICTVHQFCVHLAVEYLDFKLKKGEYVAV